MVRFIGLVVSTLSPTFSLVVTFSNGGLKQLSSFKMIPRDDSVVLVTADKSDILLLDMSVKANFGCSVFIL